MSQPENTGLPDDLRLVLAATIKVAAARLGTDVNVQHFSDDPAGVRSVLPLLRGSSGLRTLLRDHLGAHLVSPAAIQLLSPDPRIVAVGIDAVNQLLRQARTAARRSQRQQRRASRPDAESRRLARFEQRIAQLRRTRDRLEQQIVTLQDGNRDLQATIDNLDEEVSTLRRDLSAAYTRIDNHQREQLLAEPHVPRAVSRDLTLSVQVLGGGTHVGGSCVLVSAGGTNLLVDAGTRAGSRDAESMAPEAIEVLESHPPDAIVVTHAHNDHAGWVPKLTASHPRTPVIASSATSDLLATMWTDSAKVMNIRAGNDTDWDGDVPYSQADVDTAINAIRDCAPGQSRSIGALDVELFPSGHIVGATGVVVTAGDKRVVVSGDISTFDQLSVAGLRLPESAIGADVMLLESTYAGAGKTPAREDIIDRFIADAQDTLNAGGRVLVPAFALGRAQELALLCRQHLPEAEVFIDGLARDLSHSYQRHAGPDGRRLSIFNDYVQAVPPGRTQREIAKERPSIVIATSGMLTGGPSVSWAHAILPDPASRLAIVGYQDPESPGGRLLRLGKNGGGRMALPPDNTPFTVNAAVDHYQLGAHATENELLDVAALARARTVMLVHGNLPAQRRFAKRLRTRGQHTVMADRTLHLGPGNTQ